MGHMYLVGFPLLDDDNMMCLVAVDGSRKRPRQIFNTILEWKFRAENYPTEVAALSKKVVQATLEIYKNTSNELRPTPMKALQQTLLVSEPGALHLQPARLLKGHLRSLSYQFVSELKGQLRGL